MWRNTEHLCLVSLGGQALYSRWILGFIAQEFLAITGFEANKMKVNSTVMY